VPLAQWAGHGNQAVNAVALSADGCYLASAGNDRRVMLWPLTAEGRLQDTNGLVIETSNQPFGAVDIVRNRDRLLITSGNNNHRVYLDSVPLNSSGALATQTKATGQSCPKP
jgi:WD40 repeat protein